MNKSKRKLPIGWRRLTPTEKITEECMYCGKERLQLDNPPIEYWSKCLSIDYGHTEKESVDYKKYIVIKPISKKKENTNVTTESQETQSTITT